VLGSRVTRVWVGALRDDARSNPVKLYFKLRVPGRLHTHTYLLHTHCYQNGQETNAKSIPSQAWYVALERERAGADTQARLSGPSMADMYVHSSCSITHPPDCLGQIYESGTILILRPELVISH
jgi:hypothetical protein